MLDKLTADERGRLTSEQKNCYDLILGYSEKGNWTSQSVTAWALFGASTEKEKRKTRKIIHELRVDFCVPIVSGRLGYRIAQSDDELFAFCKELERKAKAATKSYFDTFRAMERNLPGQTGLFQNMNKDA